jgi:putative restriction endonuclease
VTRGDSHALDRLLWLRLHQQDGRRSPHKPLLALLAIGRLIETGDSAVPWSVAEERLAELIEEFGPPSKTGRVQAAAYPFTRLRSDGVWQIDADVPMDNVGPLRQSHAVGRFSTEVEQALKLEPSRALDTARSLVLSHFPESLVADVLVAAGLDPNLVLNGVVSAAAEDRRRSAAWRGRIVEAWDRQCAFCGYDGHLGTATVGIDAAHVRWFSYGGPDDIDNGLALCSLHHKLFDRGALGLDDGLRIVVSSSYTARTGAGRDVYELHGVPLNPRPGTPVPARAHVTWHLEQVFKGGALGA